MIIMTLFGNKILYFLVIYSIIFFLNSANSIENKIVVKVDNEIITSLDIAKEINYLSSLNKNIKNLDRQKKYSIAKESLIKEKIKTIELLNYTNKLEQNKDLINNLLKSMYLRLGLKSKDEFLNYIKNFDLNLREIENKIAVETLWNELIYYKFSNKIKINKEDLQRKANLKKNTKIKDYLLSEILFNISNNKELKVKLKSIINNIENNGFENAALIHSISESSKLGGKIGWVNENSLNKKIEVALKKLEVGDYTDPILTPSGFLILKIEDIRTKKVNIDVNKEIQNLIRLETNKQLDQYSIIYFKKIKKNSQIYEL